MHFMHCSPHFRHLETNLRIHAERLLVNKPLLWSCHDEVTTCKHFINLVSIVECNYYIIIVYMITFVVATCMSRLAPKLMRRVRYGLQATSTSAMSCKSW